MSFLRLRQDPANVTAAHAIAGRSPRMYAATWMTSAWGAVGGYSPNMRMPIHA